MHKSKSESVISLNANRTVADICKGGQEMPMWRSPHRIASMPKRTRSFGNFGDQTVPEADSSSGNDTSSGGSAGPFDLEKSKFDRLILSEWDDRFEQGLFRYDVTNVSTKALPGELGIVAQLNEGRASKKRPTEFTMDKVCQEFDSTKFNFTKADKGEVLLQFESCNQTPAAEFIPSVAAADSPHVVLINVSPIEYGHILLVPRVTDCLPQQLTPDLFQVALRMAVESWNPYFRVGYNSLGAYATINHLHFQAYYLDAPFPIERAPTGTPPGGWTKRKRNRPVVQAIKSFPVRALVFILNGCIEDLALLVGNACKFMQEQNIPFNVLIADRGARVFLIPNLFSARLAAGAVPEEHVDTGVNPAVFEISGHLLYKREVDFDGASEEQASNLLSHASMTDDEFSKLSVQLHDALQARGVL